MLKWQLFQILSYTGNERKQQSMARRVAGCCFVFFHFRCWICKCIRSMYAVGRATAYTPWSWMPYILSHSSKRSSHVVTRSLVTWAINCETRRNNLESTAKLGERKCRLQQARVKNCRNVIHLMHFFSRGSNRFYLIAWVWKSRRAWSRSSVDPFLPSKFLPRIGQSHDRILCNQISGFRRIRGWTILNRP